MAFSRAAAMSSPAWIALSMAAISRTLVEGTWLKILRYQCTMHLCQAAPGKNSAALGGQLRALNRLRAEALANLPLASMSVRWMVRCGPYPTAGPPGPLEQVA